MNMTLSKLIGIFVLIALAEGARAELKWEQTSVELRPAFSDTIFPMLPYILLYRPGAGSSYPAGTT